MNTHTSADSDPIHTVYFAFGDDRVSTAEKKRLDTIIDTFKRSDQPLQVRGFTDSIGFQAYNDDLALRRADSVRTALLQRGIAASCMRTDGAGRVDYIGDNRFEATRQLNRRVEIRFADRRFEVVDNDEPRRASDRRRTQPLDPRRVGRYSERSTEPSIGQANPVQVMISLTFPGEIRTVGAALHHLLARSGWRLASLEASDPTVARLYALPLPASQRTLGPIALLDAMGVLCGEVYTISMDPVHRLVSCELREPYPALVRIDKPLTASEDNTDEPH